ncbi:MAG: FtsQ-type POTRA domain-containing protein [Truepera sp.]|nr:FtsQ-type POTRA domain-containing protein [Truepera sp.]
MRRLMLLLLVALGGLWLVSYFFPQIERIEVSGNVHYSASEIMALADVAPGDPLLWVNTWRLRRLAEDPWIGRVRVIRHLPDTLSIKVWERTPAIVEGNTVMAIDGTVLPNVPEETKANLVVLSGWGPSRRDEALELVALLEGFAPEVISYSPGGFDVRHARGWLYTPSIDLLKEHWGAFVSQQGGQVSVYPWGVSALP